MCEAHYIDRPGRRGRLSALSVFLYKSALWRFCMGVQGA
jgi:hypothetical protein